MDKSFVLIPREDKVLVDKQRNLEWIDRPASCSRIIEKLETISSICDSESDAYKTEIQNVAKLCRHCITDICKELIERANFETTRYKRYSTLHKSLTDESYFYPEEDKGNMIEDLEINITDAKFKYAQYYALLAELKKMRLYTEACILCSIINRHSY